MHGEVEYKRIYLQSDWVRKIMFYITSRLFVSIRVEENGVEEVRVEYILDIKPKLFYMTSNYHANGSWK